MAHHKTTSYPIEFTSEDILFVFLRTRTSKGKRAEVLRFCLEYKTYVEGRWRRVVRYDNSHGTPHKHEFGWYGESGIPRDLGGNEDSARIFNENRERIIKEFESLKERFLLTK